jgi:hypothetical protein
MSTGRPFAEIHQMAQKKRRAPVNITNHKTFEAAIWDAFEPYATELMDDERVWSD